MVRAEKVKEIPRKKKKVMTSRKKALTVAGFCEEKKAQDIVILDIRKSSNFFDFFVVCSGKSDAQVKAIFENVIRSSKNDSLSIHHTENDSLVRWLLIDYFDVVLHVFNSESREFYGIERLWSEAKKIKLQKK